MGYDCNCIKEFKEKLKNGLDLEDVIMPIEVLSGKIYLKVQTKKQGKWNKENVMLSKCPWCGASVKEND